MDRLTVEGMSRVIPWSPEELAWQRCRPPAHRTKLPEVGDTVLVRLDEWSEPVEATVERVQPVDDAGDPHLVRIALDEFGNPQVVDDVPVMEMSRDPWALVWLKVGPLRTHTREARLRGVPGWLPLDHATRWRPLPPGFEALVTMVEA